MSTEQNAKDIVLELSSYTTLQGMSILSVKSIQAIGRLAMKYPFVSETCLEELLSFLELEQVRFVVFCLSLLYLASKHRRNHAGGHE